MTSTFSIAKTCLNNLRSSNQLRSTFASSSVFPLPDRRPFARAFLSNVTDIKGLQVLQVLFASSVRRACVPLLSHPYSSVKACDSDNMVKIELVEAMPQFKLNTGASIPAVGLGTWQAEPGVVGEAVKQAIKAGYRHIDCAMIYGNEKEIGDALMELQWEGVVTREELFITSKLWCSDHNPADVAGALDGSIERLQCDYLDLYLVHWPVAFKKNPEGSDPFAPYDINATWAALEKCYESGKAKAIGISNFSVEKTKALLSNCKVRPAVNQVECHPLWQQKKLAPYLKKEGIHLSAYSPLGSSNSSFATINVLELPAIKKLAEKYDKSPAQIALQWNVHQGHSVLPKSVNPDRIASNIELFDFKISDDDLKEFDKIEQHRLLRGDKQFLNDTTSPYKTIEELWDGDI